MECVFRPVLISAGECRERWGCHVGGQDEG